MTEAYNKFVEDSLTKAFDLRHRSVIKNNISVYEKSFSKGRLQYKNLELAKKCLAMSRHKVINEMDKYLVEFEANFTSRGGKIIWANDTNEVIGEVVNILRRYDAKTVVKSKSMITEEIDLNEHLEKYGAEVTETDLGEYIVQIDNDKPYHIITPIMHKSKEDVADIFNKKFGLPPEATPEEITAFVRKTIREKFVKADVGITGANFLIADIGGIALTENEGNGFMCMSFPQVHIVIAGIDKIIASIKDIDLIWPLLASHGTGQKLTAYNSIVTGPRQDNESSGPADMYVILVDNGRTRLLKKEEQRRAMACIRCGACLNFCPVYKNIGGHAYGTTYSGPIGAVISPHMLGMDTYNHLSFASSLCGRCTEVCPAGINLHELLLHNRKDAVKGGQATTSEKISMRIFNKVLLNRKWMEMGNASIKNFLLHKFFAKHWGPRRELPKLPPKSFNRIWKDTRMANK